MHRLLGSLDVAYLWDQVLRLARDPYSNITASVLLLSAVVIVVLIVVSIVIIVVTTVSSRPRRSNELEELRRLLAILDADEGAAQSRLQESEPSFKARAGRRGLYRWVVALGIAVPALALVGVALGATTSSATVCRACHTATLHVRAASAGGSDPHKEVGCVRCHESSGWLGSVTIEVPGRWTHFINGAAKSPARDSYGQVVSSTCVRCHGSIENGTTLDNVRGVKMRHKEPLAAGAQCLDCHTAKAGAVSSLTVGMGPCLRCHDGKQESAECKLCHTRDVAAATRSRVAPADLAGRKLIETPDCGLCHDQKGKCDPCHGGVRMPHTAAFLAGGHAREAVKDIWFNEGRACGTCHSATRRPCTRCHSQMPGHPVKEWPTLHGQTKDASGCAGCHNMVGTAYGGDFCGLCHSKPYVTQ